MVDDIVLCKRMDTYFSTIKRELASHSTVSRCIRFWFFNVPVGPYQVYASGSTNWWPRTTNKNLWRKIISFQLVSVGISVVCSWQFIICLLLCCDSSYWLDPHTRFETDVSRNSMFKAILKWIFSRIHWIGTSSFVRGWYLMKISTLKFRNDFFKAFSILANVFHLYHFCFNPFEFHSIYANVLEIIISRSYYDIIFAAIRTDKGVLNDF